MESRYWDNVSELKYIGAYRVVKSLRQIQCLRRNETQSDIRDSWVALLSRLSVNEIVRFVQAECRCVTGIPTDMLKMIYLITSAYTASYLGGGKYDIEKIKQIIENGQI